MSLSSIRALFSRLRAFVRRRSVSSHGRQMGLSSIRALFSRLRTFVRRRKLLLESLGGSTCLCQLVRDRVTTLRCLCDHRLCRLGTPRRLDGVAPCAGNQVFRNLLNLLRRLHRQVELSAHVIVAIMARAERVRLAPPVLPTHQLARDCRPQSVRSNILRTLQLQCLDSFVRRPRFRLKLSLLLCSLLQCLGRLRRV